MNGCRPTDRRNARRTRVQGRRREGRREGGGTYNLPDRLRIRWRFVLWPRGCLCACTRNSLCTAVALVRVFLSEETGERFQLSRCSKKWLSRPFSGSDPAPLHYKQLTVIQARLLSIWPTPTGGSAFDTILQMGNRAERALPGCRGIGPLRWGRIST